MSCTHSHDDAAYVLGALSPTERLEFERHLATCDECTRSIRSLAGMPGLLDLVDAGVLEDPPADPPLPATLLPSLTRAVDARRRRRTVVIAGLAAAAAAVVALAVPLALDDDAPPVSGPGTSGPSTAGQDEVETRVMAPQGDVPIEATLGLEQVTWGTRMLLTCTYDKDAIDVELPEQVDYLLYVTDARGHTEQVGSWTSVSGTTMTVPAATSVTRDDLASVEVRTPDGRVVLRLDA
ncbi:anti-sigma factor [Nocardioides sp.]|uniref:anti-sigma factor family protein n=1 Tax=Nocardioides sp. TaxID=35761 RepID=UPI0035B38CC3